ncbi:MAG: hypothetical protein IJU58_02175 [Clostridia bacterium]|nr:hypothetical protein [Clostridia bacterium]
MDTKINILNYFLTALETQNQSIHKVLEINNALFMFLIGMLDANTNK